jgi:hypothetical protein
VLAELEREAGKQFDPDVSASACRLIEKGLLKLGMQAYRQQAAGSGSDEKHVSP